MANNLKAREDKIFNNRMTRGVVELEHYGPVKVVPKYAQQNLGHYYSSHEHISSLALEKLVHDAFMASPYATMLETRKKRIPKDRLGEIFLAIRDTIHDVTFTDGEVFLAIASYLSVNEAVLYRAIPARHQARLVEEVHESTGILKRRKTRRLL